jgi:hypothetical protein
MSDRLPHRSLRRAARLGLACACAGLTGVLAACGSSGRAHRTSTARSTSPPSTTPESAQPPAAVTTGPVHAVLSAANHSPVVGKPWPYSVRATTAAGQPLSGSVLVEFTFAGAVVGTDHPPVHPLRHGRWHDTLTFPAAAVGHPLVLQVVVRTSAGSVTLGWPVEVTQ